MDKNWIIFVISFLFSLTKRIGCSTDIFYSGEQLKSFEDAERTCKSMNGHLLKYGNDLAKAANKCKLQSFAWLGEPWIKKIGCFKFDQNDANMFIGYITDASTFKCASYCSSGMFKHLGLSNTSCSCFGYFQHTNENSITGCSTSSCPGNTADRCPPDSSIYLYEKVNTSTTDDARYIVAQYLYGSKQMRLHVKNKGESLNFFCSRNRDDSKSHLNIQCSLNSSSSQMTESNRLTESSVTFTTVSVSSVTTSTDNSLPLGIILGIVGGVSVAMCILVLLIYCKIRTAKMERGAIEKDVRGSVVDTEGDYDNPDEMNKPRTGSEVYDHTCHLLARSDTDDTGNIYDHSSNLEGVYSTTDTSGEKEKSDNLNMRTHNVEQETGVYDSCSTVERQTTEGI